MKSIPNKTGPQATGVKRPFGFPNEPSDINTSGTEKIDDVLPKLRPVMTKNAFCLAAQFPLTAGFMYPDFEIGQIACHGAYAIKLWNFDGEISNVMLYPQNIEGCFEQMFIAGENLAGTYARIGTLTQTILITESYLDAEWLHYETGHAVVAAVFAENVANVARTMKCTYPHATIVICFIERTSFFSHRRRKIMQEAAENNSLKFSTFSGYQNLKGMAKKQAGAALQLAIETAYVPTSDLEFSKTLALTVPEDPLPWAETVNGHALQEHIKATIKKYVSTSPEEMQCASLWVFYTYLQDSFDIAPILAIYSPEKRCGKTTFFEAIMRMVPRPLSASNITPAALYRVIEEYSPTLGLDEADTFLKKPGELTGIINSGHKRAASTVIRTLSGGQTKAYNTFCAKMVAMIGKPEGTNGDRMIGIWLRRKSASEVLLRLRDADELEFVAIRSQLKKWADDHKQMVRAAHPPSPELENDRAIDNYYPLLQIASCIGKKCLDQTYAAITKIEANHGDVQESVGEKLLHDIQAVSNHFSGDRIPTQTLIEMLSRDPEQPWGTYHRGKAITPEQLAKLLKNYRIRSKRVRFGDMVLRSYEFADFKDAFERYVRGDDDAV